MTTITTAEIASPIAPPHNGFPSQPLVGRTARFAGRLLRSSIAVISVDGAIDASNSDALAEYTLGHVTGSHGMILDLHSLDFFGTEGFSALHRISVDCARVGTGWAIVPGAAASRVLRICDPQGSLPLADSVVAALGTVAEQFRRPQRLVAARANTDI
jgi:anti-anti-sigma regulatory factor